MSLFYAFVKDTLDASSCYLIAFASRSVADDWWRVVSSWAQDMSRITPQFYAGSSVSAVITRGIPPSVFQGMIIQCLTSQSGLSLPTIPIHQFTDHISGNLFSIRLKADPAQFWVFDGHNVVTKRDARPGLFRVSVANSDARNLVMIGYDEITITCAETSKRIHVAGNRLGLGLGLQDTADGSTLRFRDFKMRFRLGDKLSDDRREVIVTGDGRGDEWELV